MRFVSENAFSHFSVPRHFLPFSNIWFIGHTTMDRLGKIDDSYSVGPDMPSAWSICRTGCIYYSVDLVTHLVCQLCVRSM